MNRPARQASQSGCYHVIFRGVNHCHLFEEEVDFERLLALLAALKHQLGFKVHAYCLMDNHCHLLVRVESAGDLPQLMGRLLGGYALWFNRKYGRSGALIANRYKSGSGHWGRFLLSCQQDNKNRPQCPDLS